MKKILLTLIFVLAVFFTFSQTIERQVISSAGSFSNAGGITLSATVGEVATSTLINGTVVLTQGFQQPNQTDITSVPKTPGINVRYKIYPNPTTGILNIELVSDKPGTLNIELCDLNGKQAVLLQRNINLGGSTKDQIDLSGFAAGTYLLKLIYGSNEVKTFEVMKK